MHMKNTELTDFTPGAVRIIWRAGRSVSAVEWIAPETRPSTSPNLSIIVASMTLSERATRADSGVMPLALRSSTRVGTYFSASSALGSIISMFAGSFTPTDFAVASISAFLPMRTGTAILRSTARQAAWTVRGSEPSGSTMRFTHLEALERRLARNMAWLTRRSAAGAARSPATHFSQRSKRFGQKSSASSPSAKIFASRAEARSSLNL